MQDKMTVSLCMIVRDEEHALGKCLDSVGSFADEIIILDTGSTDQTKTIAKKYNAKIVDFEWCDDFSKARNKVFEHATQQYIFWLDADDYITQENLNKLMKIKNIESPSFDGVSMLYSLAQDEEGNTTYSLRRNRLVRRDRGFKWIGRVHEYLAVQGNIIHRDILIHHEKHKEHSDRNIKIFRDMQAKKEIFSDRDLYYFANELYDHSLYLEAIESYKAFLARPDGWIEDKKSATFNLTMCYENTKQSEKIPNCILEILLLDKPRADLCCKLGEYFLEKDNYEAAIFWYKAALNCKPPGSYFGMDNKVYHTWIPSIQLCVCYSLLEDYETAYYFNELSAYYGGDKQKISHNREYLKIILKKNNRSIPELELELKEKKRSY
ncbi:MAG: glycosyltransferase [Cellulosilyticaceae bacterium]